MPAPTTADELLDLLQKSALVEEPRLRTYVQKLRDSSTFPADSNKFAQFLVRDGLLTYFQAEQLLQGKYKRFSLGKYKVLEKLGSGGMGTVFLCEHKLMRRRVAVKVLPLPKAEDKASLERFFREAKAAAAVDHPNIVRAYDIDQDDNLHFLVMEWVDGTNLQDLVKKFGPLDVLRACHYVYGAAVGLQHAHEIGLIHRDIKPGNILIDRSGVVKILDLGLARLTQDTEDNLTRQNDENVLGTADYLAPEQALDSHTVDIRADIYSLGATFYFLLTGSALFPEGSVAQKLIWHQNRTPRSLRLLRPEVPDEIAAVVEKMMAKNPADRYQTPAEVMAALSGWMSTPIPPPADREMPTLSPAVAGERAARSSALPSMVGGMMRTLPSGPLTFSGMPTTIASGTTPGPVAAATAAQAEPAVWATLETRSGQGDTDRPQLSELTVPDEERPSRVRRGAHMARDAGTGKSKRLLFAAGGVVLLVAVAGGAYFALFNKKKDDDGGGHGSHGTASGRKITVSKAGGENASATLREALLRATPGDTIVIAEPRIVEPALKLDKNRHKDLVIESGTADGKPAVIEFYPHPSLKGGVMFDASGVEGLRLRNLEFDGKGQAERGVQISGHAPGTAFEGVTVRNVTNTGIYLLNVAGDAARPVVLDHVRVVLGPTCEGGVVSHAYGALDNKYIVIKNSRFEGPGKSGVQVDGSVVDLEISNNRFYSLGSAVSFTRPSGRPSKGAITQNTVYQAPAGLLFEVPAKDGTPYEFKVTLNYFAGVPTLLQSSGGVPVPGLTSENNLHDGGSQPGNPPLTATKLDAPKLPEPKPDDDATFLRFPAGTSPTVGPGKSRVGAQ
ncbi:MAG: serine/threonine protein kinase [Planctomycetes bacterium]|nr:serine/threonine protein kinase [Planctomycetota bacterium]